MINVLVQKFKFDCHELSETKIESLWIIHEVSFKTVQLSRDLDSFINHDFLSIRFKCSRNDWLDVTSINRILSSRKLFIFQQFQVNRRSRMTTHYFPHRFFRKFDILNRVKIINVHVNILHKRKVQEINSMNVEITDELKSRTNLKWRKILKSSITSKFVEELSDVYDSFLTFKFSKIRQSSKLTSERLQKILFDTKFFLQERKLMLKLLYRQKVALIENFSEIGKVRSKIIKNQKIRTMSYKVWQAFDFSVSKILKFIIVNML